MSANLLCQECCGAGDVVNEIIDGWPVTYRCGFCEGSGYVTPETRGLWLRWHKNEKRAAVAVNGAPHLQVR